MHYVYCGVIVVAALLFAVQSSTAERLPAPDTPFVQEYREFHLVKGVPGAASDVRGVAIDADGRVWAATLAGAYCYDGETWTPTVAEGPMFAAEADVNGVVWIGGWDGLYQATGPGELEKAEAVSKPIGAIGAGPKGVVAMGPFGKWDNYSGEWAHTKGGWADSPRAIACEQDGGVWVATSHGLFHIKGGQVMRHMRGEHEIRSGELRATAFSPDGALWVGGNSSIDLYRDSVPCGEITPEQGLPCSQVQSLDAASDGVMWVGTAQGVARYKDGAWSFRHSMRWLPNNDVRAVAFDENGSAWIATAGGISVIKRKMMTLAEKAEYFHDIVMDRKIREPFIVEKSRLLTPGDLSTWRTEDDDNDGSYTAMFMVAEAFRYRVTKDPQALENARKAFDFLEMLQTVTGTEGFIARTIVPMWWTDPDKNDNPHRLHDRNRTYSPEEYAAALIRDPRYKPVEERWIPSADGKWLWKRDTSSDEVTGHFWGFLYYYELIAETEAEKDRVRKLARQLMDHIIDGGFVLKDIDGKHTRWGVWAPEYLLEDPDWQAERPLNATEILSFLNATYYMTGDEKYRKHYRRFFDEYGYSKFARAPKPTAPSERTHIDSDLLTMTVPGLFIPGGDESDLAVYREGLRQWHEQIKMERCPMFNFVCGTFGIEDFDLEGSLQCFRDAPLDLIRWTVDNTKREDLELVYSPELEPLQTSWLPPISERPIMRWDKNPWDAVRGDGGNTESSGVYWLLPYWMGRYYGFIAAPEKQVVAAPQR